MTFMRLVCFLARKYSSNAGCRTIGLVRESFPGEKRVALVPSVVNALIKSGHKVLVERGAGVESAFVDAEYESAGANVGSQNAIWSCGGIIVKIHCPNEKECELISAQAVIGLMHPGGHMRELDALRSKGVTVFSLDCIPRTTKAQAFDVNSSMDNLIGYKSVLEAANHYGQPLGGQITAAGSCKPARVLVVGAGVAGLSAIGVARKLGATVFAFDMRPEAIEQINSMGAKSLGLPKQLASSNMVSVQGGRITGTGKDILRIEQELLQKECKLADIVISTARTPGRPAPLLLTKEALEGMRPGSVVVDIAAEQGGNAAMTVPGQLVNVGRGVKLIGWTNFASRMPSLASSFYAQNIQNFIAHLEANADKGSTIYNLNDEVIRCCMVVDQSVPEGRIKWPPVFAAAPIQSAVESKSGQSTTVAPKTEHAYKAPSKLLQYQIRE